MCSISILKTHKKGKFPRPGLEVYLGSYKVATMSKVQQH